MPVCGTDHWPKEGLAAQSSDQGAPEDLSHTLPPLVLLPQSTAGEIPVICQHREAEHEPLLISPLQGYVALSGQR